MILAVGLLLRPRLRAVQQMWSRSAAGKAGAGGKKGQVTRKKIFDIETDTAKLATHCCGLNYKLEGEEVALKPESDYPDWLWTMNVKRPRPASHELEYGTMEYFETLKKEDQRRWRTLQQNRKSRKIV